MPLTQCTFIELSIINSEIRKQFKILPGEILKISTLEGMCLNAQLHLICACETEEKMTHETCQMTLSHRDLRMFGVSGLAKALKQNDFD